MLLDVAAQSCLLVQTHQTSRCLAQIALEWLRIRKAMALHFRVETAPHRAIATTYAGFVGIPPRKQGAEGSNIARAETALRPPTRGEIKSCNPGMVILVDITWQGNTDVIGRPVASRQHCD